MGKLAQLREEKATKQNLLATILAEAGPENDFEKITTLEGDTRAKVASVRQLNAAIDEIAKAIEEQAEMEAIAVRNAEAIRVGDAVVHSGKQQGGQWEDQQQQMSKTLGELFVESLAYKEYKTGQGVGPVATLEIEAKRLIEMKTLFATTAGWAPESLRIGRVELTPERSLVMADLPAVGTTGQAAIPYMEETTKTGAAAEASEGGTYAESALALTARTSPVQKIATFIPVTDEQLEDVDMVRDYLNARLMRFIQERLDLQLLVGNGTPPNLRGILNVSGIQTQAKGADPTPTAIFKAITLLRAVGFVEPDAIVMHPLDWQDIATLTTADGIYIWVNPANGGPPERIWGLPIVITPAITQNTGLVGSFRQYCQLWLRRGVEVQVSNSHSTFFIEGKQAIRADMRAAFVAYRPTAFCTVTGI